MARKVSKKFIESGNRWKKGESGNPGGRPKLPADVREALSLAAPDALRFLVDFYQNPKNPPNERSKVAMYLVDKYYGKTPQPICGDLNTTLKIVVLDANAKIEDGVIDV